MPKPCFLQVNKACLYLKLRFSHLCACLIYPHPSVTHLHFEPNVQEQNHLKEIYFNISSLTRNRKYQTFCRELVIFPASFQTSVVWRSYPGHFEPTASTFGGFPLLSRSLGGIRKVQVSQAETKVTDPKQRLGWECIFETSP